MEPTDIFDARKFFDELLMEGDKVKVILDHENKTAKYILYGADQNPDDLPGTEADYQDVMDVIEELGRRL